MSIQSDLDARLALTSFLGEVVVNHDVRAEFQKDPIGCAHAFGVTLSQQQEQMIRAVAQDLVSASDAMEHKLSTGGMVPAVGGPPIQTACICASLNCSILY
jgi:hypothetical protein